MKVRKALLVLVAICLLVTVVASSTLVAYADDSTEELCLGALEDDMEIILDSGASDFPCNTDIELPNSVDLSASDSFPCVRDQDPMNSCVGWATTYYQFGYQVASMNDWNAKVDTTKQFSPKWTYNILNNGVNRGCVTSRAFDVLHDQGAVRFSEFAPSGAGGQAEYTAWCTDIESMRNALRYRVSDYKKYSFASTSTITPINSYNDSSLDHMKSLLYNGNVLTITTDFHTWDYKVLSSEDGSSHAGEQVCVRMCDDNDKRDGHAMAIVGYDDTIQYDLNGDGIIQNYEKGALKIVNSHGVEGYGNEGFIWVMYDALNRVSNTDAQSDSKRKPILEDYAYYYMAVEEYPLDLVAEVTLSVSKRNQLTMDLGISSLSATTPQQFSNTLFAQNGGGFNFSGTSVGRQTATFPFDYSTIMETYNPWKYYYVEATDDDYMGDGAYTIINNIKIIDSSGKSVVNDAEEKNIIDTTRLYRYKIGMMGDVDNSGTISTFDATAIQNHMAQNVTLSDEALKLADVDGDGAVNIFDVMLVQRVVAQIDDSFANGVYGCLD